MASKWECAYKTISHMSASADPLESRLLDAWIHSFSFLESKLDPESESGRKFQELYNKMTAAVAHGDEGTFAATLRDMTPIELQDMASETFDLAYSVLEEELTERNR